MKAALYLLWLLAWWVQPALCLYLGGKYINFVMMLSVVALTTSLAGYFYLWPTKRWRELEAEAEHRRKECIDAGDEIAVPAATVGLSLLAAAVIVDHAMGLMKAAQVITGIAAFMVMLPWLAEWLRRAYKSLFKGEGE